MLKATYKGRYQRGNDIFLEYEYRGRTYEVHENRAKGNEPLAWQHKSEQNLIDRILDSKIITTAPAEEGFDMFFDMIENPEHYAI